METQAVKQTKKGRGRPRITNRDKIKDTILVAVVSSSFKEVVEDRADELDITVSEYLRRLLVRDLTSSSYSATNNLPEKY
jgi:hypothetical protein